MDIINSKLTRERQELLDLSLRNTLLNYRPLRSRGVAIVDELSAQLYRLLVTEGKQMTFLPKVELSPQLNEAEADELPLVEDSEIAELARHHIDSKLQTEHTTADLQKRLLNTHYIARTYVEEQGVNVLYLALGMLAWYEGPASEQQRLAPLILIPVELQRSSVQAPFRLRYTEGDVGENLSLRAKMEVEFGLALPPLPEPDSFSLPEYFASISHAIASQPRWAVLPNDAALGFFSFGTFLMYKDLDVANWPNEASPANHDVMSALLQNGFAVPNEPLPHLDEESFIDDHVKPADSHQVIDADSSQILAILEVNRGRNLVIQGPPGTGKSQTITNIIAEAIGAGKTVLFVAEKMAALEVVKRRLDAIGLGDACLELHSHKTNKRAVLAELQRTLELGRPKTVGGQYEYQKLADYQRQLNEYSTAVNTAAGNSTLTPFAIYGRSLQLRQKLDGSQAPKLSLANGRSWTLAEFQQRLQPVQELQQLIQAVGTLTEHPFWGSRHLTVLPEQQRQIEATSQKATVAVQNLITAPEALWQQLRLPPPSTLAEAENMLAMAEHLLAAPDLGGVHGTAAEWLTAGQALEDAVAAGARRQQLHDQYDASLIPEAWADNVLPIRKAYVAYGDKWWRGLSGVFRQARRELAGLCQGALPKGVAEQRALVEAILEGQRLQPVFEGQTELLGRLLGRHWQGGKCDWVYVTAVSRWLTTTHIAIQNGLMPASLLDYALTLSSKNEVQAVVTAVDHALQTYQQAVHDVLESSQIDVEQRWPQAGLTALPLSQQASLYEAWLAEAGRVQEIVTFNHTSQSLRQNDLLAVVEAAQTWPAAGSHLVDLVYSAWYDELIKQAFIGYPVLNSFNGPIHEQRIAEFCQLDKRQFELNRYQLAQEHWQKLPRHEAGGQLGILQREFVKKRRHLPIRQLMEQAGRVIQVVKPVFMMGPMSIAMYLPPEAIHFDLVVFDEASQVRPVDAFGAILRGRQAVVVGDSKQLPPTSFFNKLVDVEEEEESVTADLESVLGLFVAQGAAQRMLRWHYRSRHASLITVSNHAFYDNKLVVFPSAEADTVQRGLVYHYLPDSAYDRGKSSTNSQEAEAVAQAVMAHARQNRHLTLGVAAFSVGQMQAIQDRLERLRRLDASCEDFFAAHPEEPFFVKNLENVQGDERDVIFISVGYGRTADGQLTMNFGPLNRDGGERRLNVLITRAKLRCEVFTNLRADDIDLSRTAARGVAVLKEFLQYAETRRLVEARAMDVEADLPFEESVAAVISSWGYEVVYQVGSAGFAIDLGVVDAERPGSYLLGVACDGGTYSSARSARDRDRLRQQVLEGLGWRVHRIWSTDWFKNQGQQQRKLAEAIEAAKLNRQLPLVEVSTAQPTAPIDRDAMAQPAGSPGVHYYELAVLKVARRPELADMSAMQVAGYVAEVVRVEGPVHEDEVARRILEGAGVRRRSSRVQNSISRGIVYAERQGLVRLRGKFLWAAGVNGVSVVRDRSLLPTGSQDFGLVAPEEMVLGIKTAVAQAYGLAADELVVATCALFGLNRVTENRKSQVQQFVNGLLAEGVLVQRGNILVERPLSGS